MVIGLYRLYDPRNDSKSINALLKEAETDSGFSKTVVRKAKSKLNRMIPICKKVATLRHKLFAHRDNQLDYDAVFKSASITPSDLRFLMKGSLLLLNRLLYYRQRTTYAFSPDVIPDTLKLLNKLKSRRSMVRS
jgi:hypothetical protein